MSTKTIIHCLNERGFVDTLSDEELFDLTEKPLKVYVGFDPTADSLHLGNLIGIMALAWFQRYGHTPIVILGGATGQIGDPSGKSLERPLLDKEVLKQNITSIGKHFTQILDFSGKYPKPVILDNADWYSQFSVIEFLRDVGKHFRIGSMLAKDSVRSRLQSEEGMSFTEFSYQVIQGYDFYHLYTQQGVTLQLGGSDQWGNITAGIEVTRKLAGQSVYGLTWPLLTRSDGKKFGKSEEGAIWLSPERCSPYQFYQYLFRIPDTDVAHMMKMLTFMEMEEIREIEKEMLRPDYEVNSAQRRLAEEVTRIVHGKEGLKKALKVTEAAAPGKEAKLDGETLQAVSSDMPNISLKRDEVIGMRYADIAVKSGLLASKGEANRLLKNGGAYLNNDKISDASLEIQKENLIDDEFLLVGAGKKKKVLIKII